MWAMAVQSSVSKHTCVLHLTLGETDDLAALWVEHEGSMMASST